MRWLAPLPPGYRWYDRKLVRRFMLARYVLRKHWHPRRRRLARPRYLYWVLVRGHDSEICAVCGGPVRLVFWVPDSLWEKAAGFPGPNARTPGGESAPGVLCPACFDWLWHEAGLGCLHWTCATHERGIRRERDREQA